jgi:hypothetical protein
VISAGPVKSVCSLSVHILDNTLIHSFTEHWATSRTQIQAQ